jgi:hypothetical protein
MVHVVPTSETPSAEIGLMEVVARCMGIAATGGTPNLNPKHVPSRIDNCVVPRTVVLAVSRGLVF